MIYHAPSLPLPLHAIIHYAALHRNTYYFYAVQYTEALTLDTSSGGSDADTLRLKAGTIVDFLDWVLPEAVQPAPPNGGCGVEMLAPLSDWLHATGEQRQS